MKDSEYLENLFIEYLPSLNAFNELSQSFYSKDEFKLRHRLFKKIYAEYRRYKLKILINNLKIKIIVFKSKLIKKRFNRTIKNYEKLKNDGYFLPKKID